MKVIKVFFDISLLQAKPQDVPFSYPLLVMTVAASIASYILAIGELAQLFGKDISVAPITVAEHLIFAGTVWAILRFHNHSERFVQTVTAMFGVNTMVQLVMWPITGWLMKSAADLSALGTEQAPPPEAGMPLFLMLSLLIWILIVYGHIFKETLETRFGAGLLYTIASWMFTRMMLLLIFDPSA